MPLELGNLRKAVAVLEDALERSDDTAFMRGLDKVSQNLIKSGVIKHFEFTYEVCWKLIKRWLEANVGPNAAEGVSRRELFRLAAENQLILDVDEWMRHHEAGNQTPDIHNPEVAESVYLASHAFARDAQRLLGALEARND